MPSIRGQKVLVIGGSTGIGFAVAELCLDEDMYVHIASSNASKITNAAERLKLAHPTGSITTHVAKLGGHDTEEVLARLLVDASIDGIFDHIILTAGKPNPRPLAEVSLQYLIEEAIVPTFVPILLAKLAPQHLKPHWTSSLIFTGGQVAERPYPGYSALSALIGGQHAFVKSLALEVKPIRVNCVAPGATDTELWAENREEMREMVTQKALLGKPGSALEVAEAYIYLMKDTNATGVNISSNGGSTFQ